MPRRERPTNTTIYQPTAQVIAEDAIRVLGGRRPRYSINNHLIPQIITPIIISDENDEPINYNIEIESNSEDPK